jgi:hypothetical protein
LGKGLLSFFVFWKNYKSGANFWAIFFHGNSHLLLLTKKFWARFWATFSPTHPVTLLHQRQAVIKPFVSR